MNSLMENNSVNALKNDEEHKINFIPNTPMEISCWDHESLFASVSRSKQKYCPPKLPSLQKMKFNINQMISLKKKQRTERERVYFIQAPSRGYPPSNYKLPFSFRKILKQPSNNHFSAQNNSMNYDYGEKIIGLINKPSPPKKDFSPYRGQLTYALNTSKTIEELLSRTKIVQRYSKNLSKFNDFSHGTLRKSYHDQLI